MKPQTNLINIKADNNDFKNNRSIYSIRVCAILFLGNIFLTACSGDLSNSYISGNGGTGSDGGTNSAPIASNVIITDDNGGNIQVGDTLTLSYTYSDADSDSEGTSLYRWFSNDIEIAGFTATTTLYTPVPEDFGTTLTVRVTPVAKSGKILGIPVFSTGVTVGNSVGVLDPSHFRSMISANIVSCTLSNGTTTNCHELKFTANNIIDGVTLTGVNDESGQFCPNTRTGTNGGVGIYDGASGAGFQQLAQTLWDNMVTDGYDIIDDSDNVCTFDNNTNIQTNGVQAQCGVNCLINSPDDSIVVVHYIPVVPENLGADDVIGEIEAVGTSLDGVPITGAPPSVVANLGNIPALDGCGGHHDPSGYYHWHFVPESADAVLATFSIAGVDCASKITQASSALTGYAKDGYPIYAHLDDGNVAPTGLDSCNGHTGATVEFPGGVYHYHATDNTAPNLPSCLKGASATTPVTPSFQ
ncbi:MAG: YHYH protein [Gammaproteobacteria bacterium]